MCACVGEQVSTLLSEAETGVDQSVGGKAPGWETQQEGERERDQGHRGLRVPLCVSQALWLSTGAAWHPQECGFSPLPRPPPVPQGGGRQEKKGGGRNLLTLKQRLIYLIFYRRSQGDQDILGPLGFFGLCEGSEDETGFGECEGVRSTRR